MRLHFATVIFPYFGSPLTFECKMFRNFFFGTIECKTSARFEVLLSMSPVQNTLSPKSQPKPVALLTTAGCRDHRRRAVRCFQPWQICDRCFVLSNNALRRRRTANYGLSALRALSIAPATTDAPVTPRGGGTSQCGQTVNNGLVVHFSKHLNRILSLQCRKPHLRRRTRYRAGRSSIASSSGTVSGFPSTSRPHPAPL